MRYYPLPSLIAKIYQQIWYCNKDSDRYCMTTIIIMSEVLIFYIKIRKLNILDVTNMLKSTVTLISDPFIMSYNKQQTINEVLL